MSQDEEKDPLHIGNVVGILSQVHGFTVGRVIYRDLSLVRVLPQEASDRAIDFPMTEDGASFAPDLGVSTIEIIEEQESPFYVDMLGVKPGDTLEFFTVDGEKAAENGLVADVVTAKDTLKLTDGRVLKFRGIGPKEPIAVVRVVSDVGDVAAAVEEGLSKESNEQERQARQTDLLTLLSGILPAATVEVVPTAERSYPESMQREDMFQDLLSLVSTKQRTNPRRIRMIEREVDLAVALKHKSARSLVSTVGEATATGTSLPAAIPVVAAALGLNLDAMDSSLSYKEGDVVPRKLDDVELESEEVAGRYLDGALPEERGRGFYSYTYDLLSRDQAVLQGGTPMEWPEDQDVVRTAGLGVSVQGLSSGLPNRENPVSIAFLLSDVTNRAVRVLSADKFVQRRTGAEFVGAPSDPSVVSGYVILPPKAALSLRPPKRPGHLPTALLYSASLTSDNLPTIAQALRDLYSPDIGSPQNAWTLPASAAGEVEVAAWLSAVLKYAVHPVDSMGPRTPALLSLLDTLGLGAQDLAPAVADTVWAWVAESQAIWRGLLLERRKTIQVALDAEEVRTFQSVTDGPDGSKAALWSALRVADSLKELLEDIGRRNPTIADAPTLMTAALLTEAQGDAAPLVWDEIMRLDSRVVEDSHDAIAALAASRAYILKRKALRDAHLLALSAAPEVNPCVHVKRLEAIRNVTDVLTQSRLLREFVEEFQGPKSGEWMTCVLCKAECVCYHELMQLEAIASRFSGGSRFDAIQKQILIKYGGDRYEGKIVCRNCGQALQDIDYDDHVEFDDQGRPLTGSSILTDEQLGETRTWIADLAPPPVVFATAAQRELGDALQVIMERGGLQIAPDIVRQIVRQADLYVGLRAPPADVYEKQRSKLLTSASTTLKAAGLPTYAAVLDQLRVSALTALTAIALQSAVPAIVVNNPFPLCRLSRGGYPFDPSAKPEDDGALLYMACVVGSIQRDTAPWRNVGWAGETKLDTRRKKVLTVALAAIQVVLGADPKAGALSFTPEIRQALTRAQTDVAAIKAAALLSLTDQLPLGYRPDPFPPRMDRPSVERDPVPAILAADGSARGALVVSLADALRVQAIAIVGELHRAAADAIGVVVAMGQKPALDAVCCPGANPLGEPEQRQLLAARVILRGDNPTAVNAGTHLWPAFEPPVPIPVEQVVDESVFFKLFLKFCYRGPRTGDGHEFGVGNVCRQCGLTLGKPIDLVDFAKEGAGILAAQQGDLRIEVTQLAFEALSESVRRRKIIQQREAMGRAPWSVGLRSVFAGVDTPLAGVVDAILAEAEQGDGFDEIGRATLWTPLVAYVDELRSEVGGRTGSGPGPRKQDVLAIFNMLTDDPFNEGPRAVQEYWCAKAQAAGSAYTVTTVRGAAWASLSKNHTDMINRLMSENSQWYGGDITDGMRPVLKSLGSTVGPLIGAWIKSVRPSSSSAWTVNEAQLVLRAIVLQGWRDAVTTSSWMYQDVASPSDRETTATGVAAWTRALMLHVKQQYVRYSKETIKRILQDRAGLERDTIVEEFESIKDDDVRAAELLKKQFRIGRWAGGANLQKYDAETFEFENEQRKRMGIMDPPVEPILPEGQPVQDYGFGLAAAPEEGYAADQGADGDDY